jgi:hypothetical protein
LAAILEQKSPFRYALMKKYLSKKNLITFTLTLFVIILIGACTPSKYSLTGRWSILNLDGTPSEETIDFMKDSTYEIALTNGQIGERGYYLLKDSVFSIKNAKDVCGKDYWGLYGLTFHGEDSVRFTLIRDTCAGRRMDIVGFNPGLKRYKVK